MSFRISPTLRISIGLVFLTLSLIMAATFVGLVPDKRAVELDARLTIVEALAVQLSAVASRRNVALLDVTLESVVERNDEVLSAALRDARGVIISKSGDHEAHWVAHPDGRSTESHAQVPIFQGDQRWGTVELSFSDIAVGTSLLDRIRNSSYSLFMFIALTGFFGFFLFLRRALKELDPRGVIPERVKVAFNSLAEGVLIMDEQERIVLANTTFKKYIWQSDKPLTGRKSSELNWRRLQGDEEMEELPWQQAIRDGERKTGLPLSIRTVSGEMRTYMVNGSPITDAQGNIRGALATFDDVTDLEQKNADLVIALEKLGKAKEEVNRQNTELQYLASRDPMTGCFNRRAFFQLMEKAIDRVEQREEPLCCMMLDIDHFKSINDNHGHDMGDRVIAEVAAEMKAACRDRDLVSRYGGEEFCIALPGLSLDDSVVVAERIRQKVAKLSKEKFDSKFDITISIGVAELTGVGGSGALIKEADMALYSAKENGRNRVVRWNSAEMTSIIESLDIELTGQHSVQDSEATDSTSLVQQTGNIVKILQDRISDLEQALDEQVVEVEKQIGYDKLTGLPNHLLFYDRVSQSIARAARSGHSVAILYLDIDGFRRVNDAFGLAAGDQVLCEVSERIASILRSSDTVATLGGKLDGGGVCRLSKDEFVIELSDLQDASTITWIVRRIFDSLIEPFKIDDQQIYISCNIGISVYPNDANESEALVGNARIARQYARDQRQQDSYAFYSSDMNDHAMEQMMLESKLRDAIKNDEFVLHYQPKLDVHTGDVVSMEALIRWNHPEMGMVSPDRFIPIAEQTGLVTRIGQWVLEESCRQAKTWLDAGIAPRAVAVNLSAVQLRSADISNQIVETIAAAGLSNYNLELEVTETTLMHDVDLSAKVLRELHSRGLHLSVDDFGTGYSSLSYLKRFSLDCLKIDRTFVRDIAKSADDRTVVSAIIAMAHRLGIRVVAEGVGDC